MNKYLKMLEDNVQWIALGLGALYLLWMAYAYVITPPVTITLGPTDKTPLTPDEVDSTILKGPGQKLESEMSRGDAVPIAVTDVLAPYVAKIDEQDVKIADLTPDWWGTRGTAPTVETDRTGNVGPLISKLPSLPAPVYVAESHGLTTVLLPNPNGTPAPLNPGMLNGGAGAQVLPPHKDIGFISLQFKVPAAALGQAYQQAFSNPSVPGYTDLFKTDFLRIDVVRQEQMPDGSWGKETVVQPINAGALPPYPGARVVSDDQPARQAAYAYRSDADKLQREIVAPAFPDVLPTTVSPWYAPGTPAPDPTKRMNGNRAMEQNQRRIPQNRPAIGGGPGRAGPGGARPAGRNGAGDFNVPQGNAGFNVANLVNDIDILVHDVTIQDGHTYRYKVHYELSNPIWDSNNLTTKELASQFALISADSAWTAPVSVRSTMRIFVTNVSSMTGKVRFDLFEWKDGKWIRTQIEAVPGDSIKDQTVVDIRQDPAKRDTYYVLLVNENGSLVKKDKRTDSMDPEYDQLKNLTSGAPAGQAAAR